MTYIQHGFTLTDSQKQALASAYQNKEGHTLRLNLPQLSGTDNLGITKTQYNKIMKAKSQGKNINLNLSATQLSKNGGALGAIMGKVMPLVMQHAPKLLGTLGLAALTGAVSGATNKAVRGSGTKSGGFILPLIGSLFGSGVKSAGDLNPYQLGLIQDLKPSQITKLRNAAKGTKSGGLGPMAGMMLGSLAMPLISKLFGAGLKRGGQLNPVQVALLNNLTPAQIDYLNGKGARLPGTKGKGARLPGTKGKGARLPGSKNGGFAPLLLGW